MDRRLGTELLPLNITCVLQNHNLCFYYVFSYVLSVKLLYFFDVVGVIYL